MRDLDIRRADLLGVPRTGTVRWYKEDKGYGRNHRRRRRSFLFSALTAIVGDGYRSLTTASASILLGRRQWRHHGRHAASEVRVVSD